MKLYAFTTPEIPKHNGYLKIGETSGDIDKRVDQECHELNIRKVIVWRDVVVTQRLHIDKMLRRYLINQGFQIQQYNTTGNNTEWIKCNIADIEKALDAIKQQLHNDEIQRQTLCNKFYLEIRNWYFWSITTINNSISPDYVLRIVIRLLLCFFLKEKQLIPNELFDEHFLKENLKENEEFRYYNAILRNLFFHCLNTPIEDRNEIEHKKLIKNIRNIKKQFQKIPFINGGLFHEYDNDNFPLNDDYFFSELRTRHLSELDGDYKVAGIVNILSQYQYKLSIDDISDKEYTQTIDPEFISKVFESLLSCIESDNKETRRKVTGSYYTPREIVDYMVNESLNAYLQHNNDLLQCKILDPACGSGAFPCGVMNAIMQRIDPDKQLSQNKRYRKKLEILQKVIYGVDIQPIAIQISALRLFLSLLQEITPNNRKENYGIEPLPNLETKFICANTLIGVQNERLKKLELPIVKATINQILLTREQYLVANNQFEKKRLQEYDESLRQMLGVTMKDADDLSCNSTELLTQWNPYKQTKSVPYFDSCWMFGVEKFDIVIGNPPYVESRSSSVAEELKKQYQNQVEIEFGDLAQYITKGSDLFIYFFPRAITLLSENGVGMLIVQNGWLNTDYGMKAAQFLMKTLQYIKITDSPFRHFDRENANVNTVITTFQKQSNIQKICFDIAAKEDKSIITKNEKSFDRRDNILSDLKWGMIMSTDDEILSVFIKIIEYGKKIDQQSIYSVGQGINVNQKTFIPKNEKPKFQKKENIINAVFKEYEYMYIDFSYFLYHSFELSEFDISVLSAINAEEFDNGKILTRKYPSIIMPRGIGVLHFAGLLCGRALSNSFIDIYMQDQDDEKKLNIWLFCNSSLFFLYREISGRKNLGGGLLKSEATDIKLFPLYFPIADSGKIYSILSKMGKPCNLQDRLQTETQREIDQLVFSYFEIPFELQVKIIDELLKLFYFRYNKAKTSYTEAGMGGRLRP
jgi:methylase of polypeptide subunit release factors